MVATTARSFCKRNFLANKTRLVKNFLSSLTCSLSQYKHAQADSDRIEALEMWTWRRMEKISWTDKVTNEDVLKKVNESMNMLNVIRQRKRKWIGPVLRHDEFLQEIFEGRMKGRSTKGSKRIQLLDDLADGKDYASLKREAEDRSMWKIRQ